MTDDPPLRGLLVDWGGVLTTDVRTAVAAWAVDEQVDLDAYAEVMRDWLGEPIGLEARFNPVHALERGELALPDFERRLADALSARTGQEQDPEGLLTRMMSRFEHAHDMVGLVRRARAVGIRTGLLSNSWGNDYPRDGWDDMFDVVVISGEVGMRKPEPQIFRHALDLLGLPPAQVVFVDDMVHNVAAAVGLGMVGIRHTSYEATAAELDVLFGTALS